MFNLGKVEISEKALKRNKLSFINGKLEEYKVDAQIATENKPENQMTGIIFEQDIYENGEFILHIMTYRYNVTVIMDAKEYIERELNTISFEFSIDDMDFLRKVFERNASESPSYERRRRRFSEVLADLNRLEQKKYSLED